MSIRQTNPPAVDADIVVSRVGLRPKLADRLAIDGHAALEHQLLRRPSGCDAGLGKKLL
jgi:hypothetical protein